MDHFKEAIDTLKSDLEIYCALQSKGHNNELLSGIPYKSKALDHLLYLIREEMFSIIDSELISFVGEKWLQIKSDFRYHVESDTQEILSDIEKKLAE